MPSTGDMQRSKKASVTLSLSPAQQLGLVAGLEGAAPTLRPRLKL